MREKLPIGIDGFEKLRTNDCYYVDKTKFIADLLHNWGEVNLFTRPRRFCKSLNMSMLKAFFEIGSDRNAEPENYWANTSRNTMVRRFIGKANRRTRSEIERLIAGECILKPINQELTYNELDSSIDHLWSVLFTTGYLTQKGKGTGGQRQLAIPNREIRELFVKQIQEWFKEEGRADAGKLEKFCGAFSNDDGTLVEEMLDGYLWKSISIRDTAVRREMKENLHSVKAITKGSKEQNPSACFYHGILLGLLQYENNWEIESNAESGEGYSDISIRTQHRTGIVIEVKYAEDGNLEKNCIEALRQIEEKQYDAALHRDGMKKIIKYGIAFYKKNCKVVLG